MRVFAPLAFVSALICAAAACTTTNIYKENPNADGGTGDQDSGATDDLDSGAGTQDSGKITTKDSGPVNPEYPATFGPTPEVGSAGGSVLTSPKVIAITYDSDPLRAQIEQFASGVGATSWWSAVTSEYGVGKIVAGTPVHLTGETQPTAITDAQIQTYLTGKLDGTHPEFGTPNSSTVYTIFYDETATITATFPGSTTTDTSCQTFGGYHDEFTLPTGMNIVYAVIPRCPNFYNLNGIDMVSGALSHELMEASTDPYVVTGPAYSGTNDLGVPYELFLGGGEIGDMCVGGDSPFFTPPGFGFIVQRGWSNAAETSGHDPCVPAESEPYFNAVPQVGTDMINFNDGTNTLIQGINVPVGTSKTVDVDLFSDGPTSGDFNVQIIDYSQFTTGQTTLNLTQSATSGHNGDKIKLTISPIAQGANGVSPILVQCTLGTRSTTWMVLVGQ